MKPHSGSAPASAAKYCRAAAPSIPRNASSSVAPSTSGVSRTPLTRRRRKTQAVFTTFALTSARAATRRAWGEAST